MTAQSSKILDAAVDTRNIAYSDGLNDNLKGANQRIDALQKRMDNSTRNMSDIAKCNDAMSADLQQIGGTLKSNTTAINENTNWLSKVIHHGFFVHTDQVTKSVADEFRDMTGKSIDRFIIDGVHQELQKNVADTNQASRDAQEMALATKEATERNTAILNTLAGFISQWIVEFAIIMGATLATPGLYKYLMLIATSFGAIIYNNHQKG